MTFLPKATILKVDLLEDSEGQLRWEVDSEASWMPQIFVEASPACENSRIEDGVYEYSQLNLKLKLIQAMFRDDKKILRVSYDTAFSRE